MSTEQVPAKKTRHSCKDTFSNKWIINNSLAIVQRYEKGVLTIRGLHYLLVAIGMTNDILHYKRVVSVMGDARKMGIIEFDVFTDYERSMLGKTAYEDFLLDDKIEEAKSEIRAWMTFYSRNKWQGQYYYPEVLIEKQTLLGVFQPICDKWHVALGACKGYPSLTFLYDIASRCIKASAEGYHPIILYFGDCDPSGEDIPRYIEYNILSHGCNNIEVRRIALTSNQVITMKLPPAPVKKGDTRNLKWEGNGQVELDAIKPESLQAMCNDAIGKIFNTGIASRISKQELKEKVKYETALKTYVSTLKP